MEIHYFNTSVAVAGKESLKLEWKLPVITVRELIYEKVLHEINWMNEHRKLLPTGLVYPTDVDQWLNKTVKGVFAPLQFHEHFHLVMQRYWDHSFTVAVNQVQYALDEPIPATENLTVLFTKLIKFF
ncbi:hypothetical protein [Chitinophaga sp. Cy-1792]|uniref:hypothetical protein n=1 Tax=Chitinophaga sp. Cy-1792 TaxID=2608339 RepID=UPI0014224B74|nr:hypothetical protein [Chitinophaga sp. Cy-1792]NIG54466.1 hypothetical protein [Chitinophaga sp. Cy-1792]